MLLLLLVLVVSEGLVVYYGTLGVVKHKYHLVLKTDPLAEFAYAPDVLAEMYSEKQLRLMERAAYDVDSKLCLKISAARTLHTVRDSILEKVWMLLSIVRWHETSV